MSMQTGQTDGRTDGRQTVTLRFPLVTVSMPMGQTDGQMPDRYITLRFPLDAASVIRN